jgi:hypothetical protein
MRSICLLVMRFGMTCLSPEWSMPRELFVFLMHSAQKERRSRRKPIGSDTCEESLLGSSELGRVAN